MGIIYDIKLWSLSRKERRLVREIRQITERIAKNDLMIEEIRRREGLNE